MIINDTTGNVEIPIREYTALMLRIEKVMARLEEFLREDEDEDQKGRPEAVMSSDSNRMTMDEFLAFSQEWLKEKNKNCAVFRFAGYWSHVNNKGAVVGAWPTIDEAIDATDCMNDCPARAFRFD